MTRSKLRLLLSRCESVLCRQLVKRYKVLLWYLVLQSLRAFRRVPYRNSYKRRKGEEDKQGVLESQLKVVEH